MCLVTRPDFPNPEKYLQHVRESRRAQVRYWGPATVDELLALRSEMPNVFAEFKPSEFDMSMIVKSCRFWAMVHSDEHLAEAADILEHDPQPQSDIEFDRVLMKLSEDADVRAAMLAILNGGAAL